MARPNGAHGTPYGLEPRRTTCDPSAPLGRNFANRERPGVAPRAIAVNAVGVRIGNAVGVGSPNAVGVVIGSATDVEEVFGSVPDRVRPQPDVSPEIN